MTYNNSVLVLRITWKFRYLVLSKLMGHVLKACCHLPADGLWEN